MEEGERKPWARRIGAKLTGGGQSTAAMELVAAGNSGGAGDLEVRVSGEKADRRSKWTRRGRAGG